MIIRLEITKAQLGILIAAMTWRLRTDNVTEIIRNTEGSWDFKAAIAYEFAQRCEVLAMLEKAFNSAMEENDD